MPVAGKLKMITGLVTGIYAQRRIHKFISGAAIVAGLALITAMLANVLLIGCFYAAYAALVQEGWESRSAFLMVGAMLAIITAVFAVLTVRHVRRLRTAEKDWFDHFSPAHRVRETANAFIDGFMAP